MSADRPSGFDHRLTAWLELDAHPRPPDALLMQVLDRVSETRRRPSWLVTERWIPMETTARFGAIPRTAMLLLVVGVMLAFVGAFSAGASQPAPADPIASDRATGAFGPGPSLLESRASHTATLLPDGRVLIAGGYRRGRCVGRAVRPSDRHLHRIRNARATPPLPHRDAPPGRPRPARGRPGTGQCGGVVPTDQLLPARGLARGGSRQPLCDPAPRRPGVDRGRVRRVGHDRAVRPEHRTRSSRARRWPTLAGITARCVWATAAS